MQIKPPILNFLQKSGSVTGYLIGPSPSGGPKWLLQIMNELLLDQGRAGANFLPGSFLCQGSKWKIKTSEASTRPMQSEVGQQLSRKKTVGVVWVTVTPSGILSFQRLSNFVLLSVKRGRREVRRLCWVVRGIFIILPNFSPKGLLILWFVHGKLASY